MSWEDSPRPPFELYFETDQRGSEDLSPEAEAFFAACVVHAAERGERRILLEGALCPRLAEGATAAIALLRKWFGSPRRPIAIEPTGGFRVLEPRKPARPAFFLTCGVDSLHLLGTNRLRYPRGHPASFADCISVEGYIRVEGSESDWYERALGVIEPAAARADLSLIPVRTNLWKLDPDLELIGDKTLGSALASTVHLFRRRWTDVTIASGRDIASEMPRGTHPMIDPLYSSSAVDIHREMSPVTRFERLRAVSGYRPGLESLVVCQWYPPPPYLNCGRCEKCVRTMTCLLALGLESEAIHFPRQEIRPEMIRAVPVGPHEYRYWAEAIPALAEKGRRDLVAVIREKIAEARRVEEWHQNADWKGWLRRLDRRYLRGRLLRLSRRLRRSERA